MFTAVVLCMDDDLLIPPPDAPIGELVTVKGHPPTPSKNERAVSLIWEKVLNEELFQVGDDEVRDSFLATHVWSVFYQGVGCVCQRVLDPGCCAYPTTFFSATNAVRPWLETAQVLLSMLKLVLEIGSLQAVHEKIPLVSSRIILSLPPWPYS